LTIYKYRSTIKDATKNLKWFEHGAIRGAASWIFWRNCMKKVCFVILLVLALVPVFGQSGTTTVNNTITINGNVYYFKPSTSPSSPLPKVTYSSRWIGDGEWWGADAAKAWASIVDWTVLHCYAKHDLNPYLDLDPYDKSRKNAYINRITAKRNGNNNRAEIKIYFWIVDKGARMEEGKPDYQLWRVEY
jgi:hypothetical protein